MSWTRGSLKSGGGTFCGVDAGDEAVAVARAAFDRQDWAAAFQAFGSASDRAELSADDWFAMADAAWWVGEIDVALDAWEQRIAGM